MHMCTFMLLMDLFLPNTSNETPLQPVAEVRSDMTVYNLMRPPRHPERQVSITILQIYVYTVIEPADTPCIHK